MLDDLTVDEISACALALLRHRAGVDMRGWYRMLRAHFGYSTGRWARAADAEAALDIWMQAHPSWVEQQRLHGRVG